MFFGARTPNELPYFGPLQKVPDALLEKHLVFSRLRDRPKQYVQDRMQATPGQIATLLKRETGHVFVCGLKGMEAGVDEALENICRKSGLDWRALKPRMRTSGRYHVETY